MRRVKVEYLLSDEEVERLERLLPDYKNYPGEKGDYPFKNWDIEKLFSALMEMGCAHDINNRLDFEERRQGVKAWA